MFLQQIKSEGLAHYSYILGDDGLAVVIDPKRDCEEYLHIAHREGMKIFYIFETHRNEDYQVGSTRLSEMTGAEIYHGSALDFKYGNNVSEGDEFEVGDLKLTVLETPGHTYESISLTLSDTVFGEEPVAVFTGDTLFIGDVGRTDFFPDKAEEVAGLLFDSIFNKLLPLGEGVLLYPAHGAGSVCGSGMAKREFSTLGYERKFNPLLRKNRQQFINYKTAEHHYIPPYFREMEKRNLSGEPVLKELPVPVPCTAEEFARDMHNGMIAVDIRSPEAFGGLSIPGSLALPLNMLPAFAGWLLPYNTRLGLIFDDYCDISTAVNYLVRIGYEQIECFLSGGLHQWSVSGRDYSVIPAIHVDELVSRIKKNADFILLDVRGKEEFEEGHLPGAVHIYVGELPEKSDRLARDKTIVTFCGSGRRAMIAASILKRNGFSRVENCFGSMAACRAAACPIET